MPDPIHPPMNHWTSLAEVMIEHLDELVEEMADSENTNQKEKYGYTQLENARSQRMDQFDHYKYLHERNARENDNLNGQVARFHAPTPATRSSLIGEEPVTPRFFGSTQENFEEDEGLSTSIEHFVPRLVLGGGKCKDLPLSRAFF